MTDIASTLPPTMAAKRPDFDKGANIRNLLILLVALSGLTYTIYSLFNDLNASHLSTPLGWGHYFLLGLALFIALIFEFVNGFHDTANAVASVIYTRSLPPQVAVVWSGFFNFLGVLISSGAVAFGIISLLPVELMLQVGTSSGFAMVFALLIAAIVWNLGTWYFGIPSSSSHTLIGSILGVGIANALMHGRAASAGVDWAQVTKVMNALLLSPLLGFLGAGLVLLLLKAIIKNRTLFQEPDTSKAPPSWIRALLISTCTGVSFAHGSNDGQKGMGLIMLILVGTAPITYALNHAMPVDQVQEFSVVSQQTSQMLKTLVPPTNPTEVPLKSQDILAEYVRTKTISDKVIPALALVTNSIGEQVTQHNRLATVPDNAVQYLRNDMFLASETIRILEKDSKANVTPETMKQLGAFKTEVDKATKFIPVWVKVAVAIALGLGTMVGWKRIVITVGEKIGKAHLTYAQGASAEMVSVATISAASMYGLPVSTTHILSSGIAGTMAANGSGLQFGTIRNLILAWVLTLPASILLSASLYWVFAQIF